MKTIVCLLTSVWLILVAGFSFASVDINEVVAGKEIRSFGSITQTERWERFDRVISGYKEVGAFPSTILGHFAYTSAKNNGYLVLVHPDFRSYKAYVAEYIRYNNLDEEISITEFENRNLSTNEKDWFYFPVHREYLQNESQKTDSVTMSQVDTIGNRLAEIPLIQAEITKLNKRVEEVINIPLSGSVGDSKSFIALKN